MGYNVKYYIKWEPSKEVFLNVHAAKEAFAKGGIRKYSPNKLTGKSGSGVSFN